MWESTPSMATEVPYHPIDNSLEILWILKPNKPRTQAFKTGKRQHSNNILTTFPKCDWFIWQVSRRQSLGRLEAPQSTFRSCGKECDCFSPQRYTCLPLVWLSGRAHNYSPSPVSSIIHQDWFCPVQHGNTVKSWLDEILEVAT